MGSLNLLQSGRVSTKIHFKNYWPEDLRIFITDVKNNGCVPTMLDTAVNLFDY